MKTPKNKTPLYKQRTPLKKGLKTLGDTITKKLKK